MTISCLLSTWLSKYETGDLLIAEIGDDSAAIRAKARAKARAKDEAQ